MCVNSVTIVSFMNVIEIIFGGLEIHYTYYVCRYFTGRKKVLGRPSLAMLKSCKIL